MELPLLETLYFLLACFIVLLVLSVLLESFLGFYLCKKYRTAYTPDTAFDQAANLRKDSHRLKVGAVQEGAAHSGTAGWRSGLNLLQKIIFIAQCILAVAAVFSGFLLARALLLTEQYAFALVVMLLPITVCTLLFIVARKRNPHRLYVPLAHSSWAATDPPENRPQIPSNDGIADYEYASLATMPTMANYEELLDLSVDDIMTPRGQIEAIDIETPFAEIREQLATCIHTRLPVYRSEPGKIIGIAHPRGLLASVLSQRFDSEALLRHLAEPYYIPSGTSLPAQLRFFREARQTLGLVVDEYGEILGLVTINDISEEILERFSLQKAIADDEIVWGKNQTALVDAGIGLRELNRALGLMLPVSGPKTLSGLIVEHLQDFPESEVCIRLGDIVLETVHLEGRRIRTVKISRI